MKQVNSTDDFEKYDVLVAAVDGTAVSLWKVTTKSNMKPFDRSSGPSVSVPVYGVMYNMGNISSLVDGLLRKAQEEFDKTSK